MLAAHDEPHPQLAARDASARPPRSPPCGAAAPGRRRPRPTDSEQAQGQTRGRARADRGAHQPPGRRAQGARCIERAAARGGTRHHREAPAAGRPARRKDRGGAAPSGAARRAGGHAKCAAGRARRPGGASAGGVHDRPAGRAQAAVEPEQSGQPRTHARLLRILRRRSAAARSKSFKDGNSSCSSWSRKSINKARNCSTLESEASREMAGLEHARAERADALAALTKQVANGNQELGRFEARGTGGGVAGGGSRAGFAGFSGRRDAELRPTCAANCRGRCWGE